MAPQETVYGKLSFKISDLTEQNGEATIQNAIAACVLTAEVGKHESWNCNEIRGKFGLIDSSVTMIKLERKLMFISNATEIAFPLVRMEDGGPIVLGTAFCIGGNRLATAAHVVAGTDANLFFGPLPYRSINEFQEVPPNKIPLVPVKIERVNTLKDICILTADIIAPNIQMAPIDGIEVGEEVISLGYPHADDRRIILTQFRNEIGAKIMISEFGLRTRHYIINLFARPGQSGGPVFVVRQNRALLIGMVIGSYTNTSSPGLILHGLNPRSLNQTTHAISATHILEVIR